ncbi:MAG: B12-binding domain-containing protein [Acidobacteria bacterium]|nr:B12-binding domain-containing protein [Acidobacteriota bacterium]
MLREIKGRHLTSREAARALGVSEASVKRWADSGLLPMEKTPGGHRRFRPEDVAALCHARPAAVDMELPALKRVVLSTAAPQAEALEPAREAALAEETFSALLEGRDEELSSLFVRLHLHGLSVGQLADSLLCAAMRRVGDLWHAGELTVAQEHVATRTALVALQGLQASLRKSGGGRMRALCCSVEDDFHELPLQLARLTLEASGLAVFDLGTSTPFSALAEAVHRFRPELVCVSSTVLQRLDRAVYEYAGFGKAARRAGAAVVLGGAGFRAEGLRGRLPADLHAESFRELEEFAAAVLGADED